MLESKIHQDAFEIWYNGGNPISHGKVAAQVGYSKVSIQKWGQEFNWEGRAKERLALVKSETDAISVMTSADRMKDMQNTIDDAFKDLRKAIAEGSIKWTGSDVKRLIEIQLLMMGQATERVEVYDFGAMSLAQVVAERNKILRELQEIGGAGLSFVDGDCSED